jgi:hypothetical protein
LGRFLKIENAADPEWSDGVYRGLEVPDLRRISNHKSCDVIGYIYPVPVSEVKSGANVTEIAAAF